MSDIKLVVVGTASSPLASQEFRYGWKQLRNVVGTEMPWIEVAHAVADTDALRSAARDSHYAASLPDDAVVLLLAHGHVLVARVVLERLLRALHDSPPLGAMHSYDSRHAPAPAPDYCTLRGMERYVGRLGASDLGLSAEPGPRTALVTLTTMGTLRHGPEGTSGTWVQDAFVHDFSDYHSARREEVIPLIPPGTRSLLDVGGGEGGFLREAKVVLGCETHLAEWSTASCAIARTHVDHVWEGDFIQHDFQPVSTHSAAQPVMRFDCITFLDVLEHTSDPHQWLKRAGELLAPGGAIVVSIPNVGHWGVIADLLEGRWDYCPIGIHCVTHLRFFTEHSVRALFSQCGLEVDQLESVKVPCPAAWAEHWQRTPGLQVQQTSWDNYAFLVRGRVKVESGAL